MSTVFRRPTVSTVSTVFFRSRPSLPTHSTYLCVHICELDRAHMMDHVRCGLAKAGPGQGLFWVFPSVGTSIRRRLDIPNYILCTMYYISEKTPYHPILLIFHRVYSTIQEYQMILIALYTFLWFHRHITMIYMYCILCAIILYYLYSHIVLYISQVMCICTNIPEIIYVLSSYILCTLYYFIQILISHSSPWYIVYSNRSSPILMISEWECV